MFEYTGQPLILNRLYYYKSSATGMCQAYWNGDNIHVNKNLVEYLNFYSAELITLRDAETRKIYVELRKVK